MRAKKWLAEQQAIAQQQIDDVDSLYATDVVEEEPFDLGNGERDDVVLLREQCEFLAQRLHSMEASFESISRNNQRPSTSPVRLVRSTSEAGATEHFPSPVQQEGEELVFGDMEESVYAGNEDDNLDDDSNKPALTFTLKEIKGKFER